MHSALWQLLWLDFRGSFRGIFNLRKNWRQLFLLVLMLTFVGLFLAARLTGGGTPSGRFGPAMPFWALLYLLATWLTASADRGLVMRPAEVHFVVGGPFPERDVITLNLIRLASRALISASVLSLLALAYVDSYVSALIGMWMLIGFSLLVGMFASLSAKRSYSGLIKRFRRVFNIVAIGCLLLLIYQSLQAVRLSGEPPHVSRIAAAAVTTPIGSVVLPPLQWLFAPLASPRLFPDTLLLLPVRVPVFAALIGMIYLLGGRYLEATTRRTDLSVAKRQSALRSGVGGNPQHRSWTSRLRLPTFPRLGGIGSVAWMQVLHSIRILPRFLFFTLTIVGVVVVVPMTVDEEHLAGWGVIAWMSGLCLYADFLLMLQLPVGFLGPVAQREMLKSLPAANWRVVLGLLAGPVVPLALVHALVTGLFLFLTPGDWPLVLATSLALLPGAWVLIANINLLGAWNVIRPRALQQRDALAAGRAMASVWIFFMMLIPAIVLGALFGAVSAVFSTNQLVIMFTASLGVLCSSAIYVLLLARSFDRWQPSAAEGGKEETEYDR